MTTLDRRSVLVGGCGVCAAALAGCAAYGPGQAAPAPAPSAQSEGSGSGGGAATAGAKLAATSDVPVGGGIILADAALVITQPKAGAFKAFSAICTHQGCTVNAVVDGTINCPCHGSQFAIADGSVVNGPAQKPLPAKKIIVSGGSITAA